MLYISEKNHIVVDVTKPPYNADNTGKVDCTAVLCKALDDILQREIDAVQEIRQRLLDDPRDNFRIGFENRKMGGIPTVIFPEDPPTTRILYFPEGTYLISDTITYSHSNLVNLIEDMPGSDLNRFIRFVGAGKDKTTIKLEDNCPRFCYGERRPMISFARTRGSNVNMMNSIEDMSLDAGCGNIGAVGLRFSSSNTGKIAHISIRSSDPEYRGFAGVWVDSRHQAYYKDIEVDGFDYGIYSTNEWTTVFEGLRITNAKQMGVFVNLTTLGIRDAVIESYGSGVRCEHGGMLNMENVTVRHLGKRGGEGIRSYNAFTRLRNFTVENFEWNVQNNYDLIFPYDGTYSYFTSTDREWRLFPTKEVDLGLPVLPAPEYRWNGDRSIVAEVDDFGAVGDGVTDSTAAIQRAMNSGKEYIVFGEGRYLCSDEIHIPKTVKAINFMYCDFAGTPDFLEEKEKGLFAIDEDSDEMLFIDDGFVFEKFYGYLRFIRHSAKRDLCVSDLHVQTGAVYFNTVKGNNVFMDNVASTMGVFGGIGYGTVPCFRFTGEKVWIRQFNPERSTDNVIAEEGSDMWIYGFKTEGPSGKAFTVHSGSRAEIYCGHATIATDDGTPCIESLESSVFAWFRTRGGGPHHQFTVAVREVQNGCERKLLPHQLPPYSVEYYYIPGFIGVKDSNK